MQRRTRISFRLAGYAAVAALAVAFAAPAGAVVQGDMLARTAVKARVFEYVGTFNVPANLLPGETSRR